MNERERKHGLLLDLAPTEGAGSIFSSYVEFKGSSVFYYLQCGQFTTKRNTSKELKKIMIIKLSS